MRRSRYASRLTTLSEYGDFSGRIRRKIIARVRKNVPSIPNTVVDGFATTGSVRETCQKSHHACPARVSVPVEILLHP
jgi:hypothetical protein